MRIAVVSDIHGDLAAFEAVLKDLRTMSPDLVLHGGDLADHGPAGVEIVDRIRDLGWPGVAGNTDEMLFRPASVDEFVGGKPHLKGFFDSIAVNLEERRAALGEERLAWLRDLPRVYLGDDLALVHASPGNLWTSPSDDSDFVVLQRPLVVYGHIHRPYIRQVGGMTVANSGSVSLSHDGDPRPSYMLIDDSLPAIRRVEI